MAAPLMFMSHGGGPAFFMKGMSPGDMMYNMGPHSEVVSWYKGLAKTFSQPKAIVVVSAHWEEHQVTVIRTDTNSLLYDYYGFPDDTYKLTYDAPGSLEVADRVAGLLKNNGIESESTKSRGLDHGVFIPLKLLYPEANIPVIQISLLASLDPRKHYKLGEALAPLLEEGVAIIGSGQATHNLRQLRQLGTSSGTSKGNLQFLEWLDNVVTNESLSPAQREDELCKWSEAPGGREAHPREEHLIPLMVIAGAAKGKAGKKMYDQWLANMSLASYSFDGLKATDA